VWKRYVFLWLLCLLIDVDGVVCAQPAANDARQSPDVAARFVGLWSQSRPPRDFEGGCVVGYLTFKFEASGYFIFNNRERGTWWVDELGNVVLRTRDGLRLTLYFDGGSTLRPSQDTRFTRRTYEYTRCPNK